MAPPDGPAESASDRTIVSSRAFAAPRETVFAAFADPAQLAQWWGPTGFTNKFREFDFRPGGRWRFTMQSPDGAEYHNECDFTEIVDPARIVFVHQLPVHRFEMTMTFVEQAGGTALTWRMVFDSAADCEPIKRFIADANEQNFDRLAAHLARNR
jgi:uncharacterized protein YndB with AHSA1/START domain